ncbi:hypothetical protein K437DRAFT_117735 [Tilletiaria anomala UBC 951]|uniref:Uncharacterized protein n=1 Tax=Tilletiaria anomala (strain ATCC 24038 / CBS 436.72 / UBC 951) TaxID=1037660 RepID=A0A066WGN4_TILAU|nr:uncharacterized protein K437DRAFT_117735 [Tilletiaria anomala UBC 951]KDN53162.1 hypothetical protein K437DRAFT_117735 [Tilletiaria anomala UBC 951]
MDTVESFRSIAFISASPNLSFVRLVFVATCLKSDSHSHRMIMRVKTASSPRVCRIVARVRPRSPSFLQTLVYPSTPNPRHDTSMRLKIDTYYNVARQTMVLRDRVIADRSRLARSLPPVFRRETNVWMEPPSDLLTKDHRRSCAKECNSKLRVTCAPRHGFPSFDAALALPLSCTLCNLEFSRAGRIHLVRSCSE